MFATHVESTAGVFDISQGLLENSQNFLLHTSRTLSEFTCDSEELPNYMSVGVDAKSDDYIAIQLMNFKGESAQSKNDALTRPSHFTL